MADKVRVLPGYTAESPAGVKGGIWRERDLDHVGPVPPASEVPPRSDL